MPAKVMQNPKRGTVSDETFTAEDARKELRRPETANLMRQFMKNKEGETNSTAYRNGWDIAFGTPEQKAEALKEREEQLSGGSSDDDTSSV